MEYPSEITYSRRRDFKRREGQENQITERVVGTCLGFVYVVKRKARNALKCERWALQYNSLDFFIMNEIRTLLTFSRGAKILDVRRLGGICCKAKQTTSTVSRKGTMASSQCKC